MIKSFNMVGLFFHPKIFFLIHTVDGRNPAPGMCKNTVKITGVNGQPQVVSRNSEPSTINDLYTHLRYAT